MVMDPTMGGGVTIDNANLMKGRKAFADLSTEMERNAKVFIHNVIGDGYKTVMDEAFVLSTDIAAAQKNESLLRSVAGIISSFSFLNDLLNADSGTAIGGGNQTTPPGQLGSGTVGENTPYGDLIIGEGARIQGINSEFFNRFMQFASFIYHKYGQKLTITSGFRTYEEQLAIWERNEHNRNWAAPPGHSYHEKGLAIDYDPESTEYNQYLGQFGLWQPLSNELWHIEPIETKEMRGR